MFELKGQYLCNELQDKSTTNDSGVDKTNILQLNHREANINTSRRKYQYPLYMIVPDIKSGNYNPSDFAFQFSARRLIGITTISRYDVLR